jgi:hypothetical protein
MVLVMGITAILSDFSFVFASASLETIARLTHSDCSCYSSTDSELHNCGNGFDYSIQSYKRQSSSEIHLRHQQSDPSKYRGAVIDREFCPIEAISIDSITREVFRRDFLSILQPALFRTAANNSERFEVIRSWNRENFRTVFGDLIVKIGRIPYADVFGEPHNSGRIPLRQFIGYLDAYNGR